MKKIDLGQLSGSQAGLSPAMGGFLAEAASVCFEHHGHPRVFELPSTGHYQEVYEITRNELHPDSRTSFADMQESTEYGACGVALAIIATETGYVTERSWKGTGFDYWLGEKQTGLPFQRAARLEVSGIINGTLGQAEVRLKEKLKQMDRSEALGLPAIAIVVEFANPLTKTAKQ